MTISRDAVRTLVALEHGGRFNCIHAIARELIDEGYAFDGWGKLEITEMGRRAARTFRSVSPEVANMGDLNEPKFETPLNSHGIEDPDPVPIANKNDLITRRDQIENDEPAALFIESKRGGEMLELPADSAPAALLWSRERAMKAAGVANGAQEVWVGSSWVRAFMEAYEKI
jgi:hypothetical protein